MPQNHNAPCIAGRLSPTRCTSAWHLPAYVLPLCVTAPRITLEHGTVVNPSCLVCEESTHGHCCGVSNGVALAPPQTTRAASSALAAIELAEAGAPVRRGDVRGGRLPRPREAAGFQTSRAPERGVRGEVRKTGRDLRNAARECGLVLPDRNAGKARRMWEEGRHGYLPG